MINRIFVDTNILIYAYLDNDIEKRDRAIIALDKEPFLDAFYISTQVLNEFCSMFSKTKYRNKNINDYYFEILNSFGILIVSTDTISSAIKLQKKYSTSWWDALMLASAIENNCNIMFTEDLEHNQIIENKLSIINPLL